MEEISYKQKAHDLAVALVEKCVEDPTNAKDVVKAYNMLYDAYYDALLAEFSDAPVVDF